MVTLRTRWAGGDTPPEFCDDVPHPTQEDWMSTSVAAPFRTEVTVTGMTCRHCVMSVAEEVREIAGVSEVDVRLDTGAVTVLADREVAPAEIASALDAAGFGLAG